MTKIRAAIKGIEAWVPDYVLTNAILETMVDTSDEWITTRTGIKERRILQGEGLGTSEMASRAVEALLKKTNTNPLDVDMLICATVTPDMQFPATANIVSDRVGIKNAFSFDLAAACSSFIYALTTASKYIESGSHKKIIVIGGDKMSSIVDYTQRETCVIFGDAAGAVLLEPTTEEIGIMDNILRTDGSGWAHLHQKAGGSRKPASRATVDAREHYVYQEGQAVFKFAVTNMADVSVEIMERNNLTSNDIAFLVPHQANLRIIDATARRMGLSREKVMINIERYGNTTNGTIPLCLWEWEKKEWTTVREFHNGMGNFDWTLFSVDISEQALNKVFKIRFMASGKNSIDIRGWFLDNIHVFRTCQAPGQLVVDPYYNDGIRLNWQLGSSDMEDSRALSGCKIYRSIDGAAFEQLPVLATGSHFVDDDAGLNYGSVICYKITALYESESDLCESEFSNEVCVVFTPVKEEQDNETANLVIFPNPASDLITLSSSKEITRVIISGITGKVIAEQKYSGEHKILLDVSSLPNGLYTIQAFSAKTSVTRKLAVAR